MTSQQTHRAARCGCPLRARERMAMGRGDACRGETDGVTDVGDGERCQLAGRGPGALVMRALADRGRRQSPRFIIPV